MRVPYRHRMGQVLLPVLFALGPLVAAEWLQTAPAAASSLASSASHPAPLLVAIYPPWWSAGAALNAAGAAGAIAGLGALPFIIIAAPVRADGGAGLRAGGAWLVLDGAAVRLCGATPTEPPAHGA